MRYRIGKECKKKRLTLDMSRSKGVEYAGGYCPNVVGWMSSIASTDSIREKFKGVERNATGGRAVIEKHG